MDNRKIILAVIGLIAVYSLIALITGGQEEALEERIRATEEGPRIKEQHSEAYSLTVYVSYDGSKPSMANNDLAENFRRYLAREVVKDNVNLSSYQNEAPGDFGSIRIDVDLKQKYYQYSDGGTINVPVEMAIQLYILADNKSSSWDNETLLTSVSKEPPSRVREGSGAYVAKSHEIKMIKQLFEQLESNYGEFH